MDAILILASINSVYVLFLLGLTFSFHAWLKRPERYRSPNMPMAMLQQAEYFSPGSAGILAAPSGRTSGCYDMVQMSSEEHLPSVSVIVVVQGDDDAVDCLRSLAKQDYPDFELLVVDDRTNLSTRSALQELSRQNECVKLIRNDDEPPAGWQERNFAIDKAVPVARGDWLMFAMSNTRHNRNSIRLAMQCALSEKVHMVSFWPLFDAGSPAEKIVLPVLWGAFYWGDAFHLVNDAAHPKAYAVNYCMLVQSSVYKFVGGHRAVKEWLADDHGLSVLVKESGFHLLMADGRKLFLVRLRRNLDELRHSIIKRLFAALQFNSRDAVFMFLNVLSMTLLPFFQLLFIYAAWIFGLSVAHFRELYLLVVLQTAATVVWYLVLTRHFRALPALWYFLLPLGSLLILPLIVEAVLVVKTGAVVRWKGQTYTVPRLEVPGGS